MQYQDNTALLIGSFDPFHEGHLHLLKLAQNNYKKIIICVANNENKKHNNSLIERQQKIIEILELNNLNHEVIYTDGLTVDLCKKLRINVLIRGYRNYQDFKYEKSLLKQYKKSWKSIKVKLYKAKENKDMSSTFLKQQKTLN